MSGKNSTDVLFSGLPDDLREALLLTFAEEFSFRDLAAMVGASEETLRARAVEARRRLRACGVDDRAIDAGARRIVDRPLALPEPPFPIRPRRVRSWWSPRTWIGSEPETQRAWSRCLLRFAAAGGCALMTLIVVDAACWLPGDSEGAQFANARDIELPAARTGTRVLRPEVEGARPAARSPR